MQGAGGVGGLIEATYYGTATTSCFAAFDGNGNVSALINAADGTTAAQYEYGPFGEPIRATGPMAKVNPFRFSTEYQDDESDIVMYPYRPYSASQGRFLCKDPMTEPGFNLLRHGGSGGPSSLTGDVKFDGACYVFVQNDAISGWDYMGLCDGDKCGDDVTQPLGRTLDWIRLYYGTLSYGQKFKSCITLYDITDPHELEWAWDILYLKDVGFGTRPSGTGNCARTVTFQNRCYYGGAANYAMWGKVNKLCFDTFGVGSGPLGPWSLPWSEATVFLWKVRVYHHFGDEELQATAFTAYGYGLPLLHGGVSSCPASANSVKNYAFNFRWLPYRNPDHK
jgi:RHS repeat-associated protein